MFRNLGWDFIRNGKNEMHSRLHTHILLKSSRDSFEDSKSKGISDICT